MTVANATNATPLFTTGSGNTVTAEIQVGAAITGAPADMNDAGLVSFDDSAFAVDANGYVTLIGGGTGIETLTGDDLVATGPDGSGNLGLTGLTVVNATNAKPVYVNGGINSEVVEVQVGVAVTGAPGNKNDAGLVSFDDTAFAVDVDGYVTLVGGGGAGAVMHNIGDDGLSVDPDGSGNFTWLGSTVANATHAKPVYFKDSTTANAIDLDVQVAAAVTGAPGDKNDAGLCSFDDTAFAVDANGYVTLIGGGGPAVDSFLVSSGTSPVVADASGQITITDGNAITVTGGLNAYTIAADTATTAAEGVVELATTAEVQNGTYGTTQVVTAGDIDSMFAVPSSIGSTTPNSGDFTVVVVDNITIDTNNITTTNTNGALILEPNGTGSVTANTDSFLHTHATASGGTLTGRSYNTEATAAGGSSAKYQVQLDAGTDGFAAYANVITSTHSYMHGIDSSDSYVWKMEYEAGTSLPNFGSGTEIMRMTTTGEFTLPKQPAFSAYLATSDTNLTGDGTNVFLGDTDVGTTLTERFDQGGDFTPGASGGAIFTAPVTGQHQFNFLILLQNLTASTDTYGIDIRTSNENYKWGDQLASQGNGPASYSVLTDMDAADTCQFRFGASGGAKDVGVFGAGTPRTAVSGFLAC